MSFKSQLLAYSIGVFSMAGLAGNAFGQQQPKADVMNPNANKVISTHDSPNRLSYIFNDYFGDTLEIKLAQYPDTAIKNQAFQDKFVKHKDSMLLVHAAVSNKEDIFVVGFDKNLDDNVSRFETQRLIHYKQKGRKVRMTSVSEVEGAKGPKYIYVSGARAKLPKGVNFQDLSYEQRLSTNFKKGKLGYADDWLFPFQNNYNRLEAERRKQRQTLRNH